MARTDPTTRQLAAVVAAATGGPGASLDHPFGPEVDAYKVAGKVFALVLRGGPAGRRVNLKAAPADGAALRAAHRSITAGYHMDKRHWITIELDGTVPDALLAQLVDDSYDLVVEGLPRRVRANLG